jgi:hypothetical protein
MAGDTLHYVLSVDEIRDVLLAHYRSLPLRIENQWIYAVARDIELATLLAVEHAKGGRTDGR